MGIARVLKIPGDRMTHTTVTSYPTWQQCAAEVERVLSCDPA